MYFNYNICALSSSTFVLDIPKLHMQYHAYMHVSKTLWKIVPVLEQK